MGWWVGIDGVGGGHRWCGGWAKVSLWLGLGGLGVDKNGLVDGLVGGWVCGLIS